MNQTNPPVRGNESRHSAAGSMGFDEAHTSHWQVGEAQAWPISLASTAAEPSEQRLLPFSITILPHNCVATLPSCPVPLCSSKLIRLYGIGDIPTFLSYKNSNNYGCVCSYTCIYTFPNKCFTNTADILKTIPVKMWFSLWPWGSIPRISTYLMWGTGFQIFKKALELSCAC